MVDFITIVADPNPDLIKHFDQGPGLVAVPRTFESLDGILGGNACVTNAGNGLGIMGAGMAGALQKYFGTHIQHAARAQFASDPAPVGSCHILSVGPKKSDYRWCAYTVTMEQPGTILDPADGVPYTCMFNTLQAVDKWNLNHTEPFQIRSLVVPGFGGGIGGLDEYSIATEMQIAFEDFSALPSA